MQSGSFSVSLNMIICFLYIFVLSVGSMVISVLASLIVVIWLCFLLFFSNFLTYFIKDYMTSYCFLVGCIMMYLSPCPPNGSFIGPSYNTGIPFSSSFSFSSG